MQALRAACVLLLCLLQPQSILATEDTGKGTDADLTRTIDTLLADPELQTGFQGILIQSIRDTKVLYERNADHVFQPASNNKLLTAAAALLLLGQNFTYHTRLYAIGELDADGTLHGDLILKGDGDPILSMEDLNDLAQQAVKAGLRRITGRLRYDDSRFDDQRLGDLWTWDDEPYYYSAQISALNVNENVIQVHVTPGRREGNPVKVTVTPTAKYVTIVNTARTGPNRGKASLRVDRIRGVNTITVSGILPHDSPEKAAPVVTVTIEDPSRFTTQMMLESLQHAGIPLKARGKFERETVTSTATVIADHTSLPLSEILKKLNKPSDNLIAECLLKTVGAVKKGQGTAGSGGTGAQTAREWFRSIGIDVLHLNQADGSGLSRVNYVSPRNIVCLLNYLHTQPTFALYYDSLPIAGVDGSLRNRMKGTAAEANCHAKTGYISHASSLSGYVTTRDGELLVFSMLMNNHLAPNRTCTTVQDKIVVLLAEYRLKR
jgi:D-alanyl-D-alanine carboxypeptidase/D-alanyl-D-alanine-endopeptidase (penicillin-binding protein 4)